MKITLNVNDAVKVKLTKHGIKTYEEHLKKYYHKSMRDIVFNKKDEYVTLDLWELMHIFGKDLYHGNEDLPFENNEIIVE